jgi:hypothetical protein
MTWAIAERAPFPAASGRFYVWMALACMLVAFAGFAPTYWLPLAGGTLNKSPIVHFHAAAFFSWTAFFVLQASLASSGKMIHHRTLGVFGATLAATMLILGLQAQRFSLQRGLAAGFGTRAELLSFVSVTDLLVFGTLIVVALANVRRADIHKRLMILATVSLLGAPVVRLIRVLIYSGPPGPPLASVVLAATLAADVLILIALLHDWRTQGRPHPAYVMGGGAMLFIHLARMPAGESQAWHALVTSFSS